MSKKFLSILMAASFSLPTSFFCGAADAGAESNPPPFAITAVSGDGATSNEALRAYLQLQEQIHATQLAVERAGRETELATLRNAAVLSNRLQAIEQTVMTQQAEQLRIVRSMMIIAGTFVAVGVLALLLTAIFHWRAVSRLAEIAAALPSSQGFGALSGAAALGLTDNQALLEQTNRRLLGAIERLEKRILEIELVNSKRLTNGHADKAKSEESAPFKGPPPSSNPPARVADSVHAERFVVLLGKGQDLLAQDHPEEALSCFDEALAFDPQHAELLVKKGEALERLRRSEEAIECYNRAITADDSLTIAYLHKGGLLNRMERFDEAMQCYEQALRTQESKRAA